MGAEGMALAQSRTFQICSLEMQIPGPFLWGILPPLSCGGHQESVFGASVSGDSHDGANMEDMERGQIFMIGFLKVGWCRRCHRWPMRLE